MNSAIKTPELLSPAGNREKLEAALRFGADAVYLAGQRFGMRAAADNFSIEELFSAAAFAHENKKKIYLTLNVMPREYEMKDLEAYLEEISSCPLDAVIVADFGVFSLCQMKIPHIPVHISTQAGAVNSYGCLKWYEMGARRIVLPRELSLQEISAIKSQIPNDLELEAFVHGSMCVSFSGRCLLSEFYTGRDANRGECTQPCRWQYQFHEEKRPDDILTCEIHPEGSYIFGSKDLCMIDHIKDLVSAGIDSFKIEGRMKSAYYTAVVTNAYRIALERFESSKNEENNEDLMRELNSVSHREYSTGYFFDPDMTHSNLSSDCGYIGEKSYLCLVEEGTDKQGFAKCIQRNKFSLGDACEFISPGTCGKKIKILEMLDENKNPILSCPHPKQVFYIKTNLPLKAGDLLRK